MKAVILAGGFGTRISEETHLRPKPMIEIGGKPIRVFGDGRQVRDYIYVEDLADAFIRAAVCGECHGKVFNVGSGSGVRFCDMAETIVRVVGKGQVEYVPWPADYINVETGDYVTDITRIATVSGWQPATDFQAGVEQTCAYYRENRSQYW